MTALLQPDRLTVEEYFDFEETSEVRHDFYSGHLVPVEAATKNHGRVLRNIEHPIATLLRGQPCEVFTQTLKVHVEFHDIKTIYYYPDLVVDCPDEEDDSGESQVAEKPRFIAEVRSKSSEHKDEIEKYSAYQLIPSLEEYLVINQDPKERWARLHRKSANWRPQTGDIVVGSGEIHLRSIDLKFDLAEIYDFS